MLSILELLLFPSKIRKQMSGWKVNSVHSMLILSTEVKRSPVKDLPHALGMQPQAPGVSMAKIFYILEGVWNPPNTRTRIFQSPLCTCLWTDFDIYHSLPKPVYTLGWKLELNILWQSLLLYQTEWPQWTLQKGEVPWRETWIRWKTGLTRNRWSSAKTSVRSYI